MKIKLMLLMFFITSNSYTVTITNKSYSHGHSNFTIISDSSKGVAGEMKYFLSYLKKHNKYKNVQVFNFVNIASLSSINNLTSEHIFELGAVTCFKGKSCNNNSNAFHKNKIALSAINTKFKEVILGTPSSIKSSFELNLVIFSNNSININSLNEATLSNEYDFEIYYIPNLIQDWLPIISRYDTVELERGMKRFYSELATLHNECKDKQSPYCLIKSNDLETLINYIKIEGNNKNQSVELDLLLDFAYKSNNKIMSSELTKMNLRSIMFPDNNRRLYAASYYNYLDIVKYITENKDVALIFDLDYEYISGLTILGVAIFSSSFDVMKLLINDGAKRKGKSYNAYMFNNPDLYVENRELAFELLKLKYKEINPPNILRDEALMIVINIKGKLSWLKNLFKESPLLFKAIFVDSKHHARLIFITSAYDSNSQIFDFLVSHGVDLCVAFDNEAMKSLDNTRIKDESLWLNSRYKQYLEKCERTLKN